MTSPGGLLKYGDLDEARVLQNLAAVRARIAAACARKGRDPAEVELVAVTKSVGAAEVLGLVRAGVRAIGENRVKDAVEKAAEVAAAGTGPSVRVAWHLVGHLQRNKVGKAVRLFSTIHSLDSPRLLDALISELGKREAGAAAARLDAYVEVNVSGEETKGGVRPEEALPLLEACLARGRPAGLFPVGLMTVAPLFEDPAEDAVRGAARDAFRRLRDLRDEAVSRLPELLDESPAPAPRPSPGGSGRARFGRSMGMTGDFEVAVEEGATAVRIGTALFRPAASG